MRYGASCLLWLGIAASALAQPPAPFQKKEKRPGAASPAPFTLAAASQALPRLPGKPQNAKYLRVTAGDRLYSIGDQGGGFPEVGFHVPGEMGGIWQQPIKLFDGYRLEISNGRGFRQLLGRSDAYTQYSFTTQNLYRLPPQSLEITRTEFVPDGLPVLAVEYRLRNTGAKAATYTLTLCADVDLRPVWLGEENGMPNGPDALAQFNEKSNAAVFKDQQNSWFASVAADRALTLAGTTASPYQGRGLTGKLATTLTVPAGQAAAVRYYLAGSTQTSAEALANSTLVENNLPRLFAQKRRRYEQLAATAQLAVPDKALTEAWNWGKYATDWLVRDVPGLGRGLSAGLPDYPWFFSNDQAHTFDALTGFVSPQLFYDSFRMLKSLSDKANQGVGRIIHEASTNGVVYDKGRMEESQLHLETAWHIFEWTGNRAFLQENYRYAQKTLAWLWQHDQDHDLYVEGYGGVEIKGLNDEMLDVAVHTQQLLGVMAQMAAALGEPKSQLAYQAQADTLRAKINRDWWVSAENRYADFLASPAKALELVDTALVKRVHPARNRWAAQKLTALRTSLQNGTYPPQGYVVYYNSSALLPLAAGIADSAKARQALAHARYFTNKYGVYISGIERPDDITADEGSVYARNQGEFNYNQAVMPGATATLAIAESRYGSPDTALSYVHQILASFGYATPGTTYEVSPDYGMFVQAWNITGLYIPVVRYFFGLEPRADKKELTLRPSFPHQWPTASLRNLLIGNTKLSIAYQKEGGSSTYLLSSSEPGWRLRLAGLPAAAVSVNGKRLAPGTAVVALQLGSNEIKVEAR